MGLPSRIQVLGVPFNVELVDFEDEGQCGETMGLHRKIKVSKSLDSKRQWTTFVHEYCHAVFYVMGAASEISDQLEECMVQSMEHGIEQLLVQVGPELMNSYTEGE